MSDWLDFLDGSGARFAQDDDAGATRRVVGFGDPLGELSAAERGAVACPLNDSVAISIEGPDATAFLQGQFTNDVSALSAGAVQFSGYCSPKGRMLANFPLARVGDGEYLLIVPLSIAESFVRRLRMFVLRSNVKVASLASTHACIGFNGSPLGPAAGTVVRNDAARIVGLPDGRAIAVCTHASAAGFWQTATQSATAVGEPVWDWLAIRDGIPVIAAATQDRFVPQMLNWELIGGVSFRKGCYPGQEIVARMQYLGRLKERLYRAHIDGGSPAPGASLYGSHFGDQASGTIVNAAPAPGGGFDLLAVLQIASAQPDALRLDPLGGGAALELLPLPYPVAEPRAAAR